jgi:hypothetical protein
LAAPWASFSLFAFHVNKRFLDQVTRLRPDLAVTDGHFYYVPIGDIVSGFLREKTPNADRVISFALPLYDRNDYVHLTFGEALPIDQQALSRESAPKADAMNFLQLIQPYEPSVRLKSEPGNFLKLLRPSGIQKDPWIRRAYVLTSAFLGDLATAKEHFSILERQEGMDRVPHWREDLKALSHALLLGPEAVSHLFSQWKAYSIRQLGLSAPIS